MEFLRKLTPVKCVVTVACVGTIAWICLKQINPGNPKSSLELWKENPTSSLTRLKADYDEVSVREWELLGDMTNTGKLRPAIIFHRTNRRIVGQSESPTTEDIAKKGYVQRIAYINRVKISDLEVYATNKIEVKQLPKMFTGFVSIYEKHTGNSVEFFAGRKVHNFTFYRGEIINFEVGHVDW